MERLALGLGETLAKEFGASENVLVRKTGGKLKGKGNSVVSNRPPPKAVRAALTDITNTHQPSQTSKFDGLRDDIGNLQKENLMLRKLLEERNRIIEANRIDIEKLQISSQKLYMQNFHLAKSYSLMLKEVNMAKDKLKEQQHEHGCALAMLKAKLCEHKEKATKVDKIPIKSDKVAATTHKMKNHSKMPNLNGRRKSTNLSSEDYLHGILEVTGVEPNVRKRHRESSELITGETELENFQNEFESKDITKQPSPSKGIKDDGSKVVDSSTCLYFSSNGQGKLSQTASVDPQNEFKGQQFFSIEFTRPNGNADLLDGKPTETSRRMLRSRSRVLELKQLDTEVKDEVSNSDNLASDTLSCAPEGDIEHKKEVERRRSDRAATQKIISYKEKKINLKERRPELNDQSQLLDM